MTVIGTEAMARRAAANAAPGLRDRAPEAPARESTEPAASPATPSVLAADAGGEATAEAKQLPDYVPADAGVSLVPGDARTSGSTAASSDGAVGGGTAVGNVALSRPDRGGEESASMEDSYGDVMSASEVFQNRIKINVWHAPMNAWRVTEMWVKPGATWNQVKGTVACHIRRRGGPYAAAPAVAMHRVIGRDDGLWYHWRDRIVDPANTQTRPGREDPAANTLWRDQAGTQRRTLSSPMYPNNDALILEDSPEVKSVVLVPNKDFHWSGNTEVRL